MANSKREVLEQVRGVVIPDVGGELILGAGELILGAGELILGSQREGRGYRESQQTLNTEDNAYRAMRLVDLKVQR